MSVRDEIAEIIESIRQDGYEKGQDDGTQINPKDAKTDDEYLNEILSLPVGGEVEEDCDKWEGSGINKSDLSYACGGCDQLGKSKISEGWFCKTDRKITRAKTIADCEGE